MPISNFPNGFAQGVAIRGIPLLSAYGGDVYWVDSGSGADTGKGTHNQPWATIDYAIGRCTANNGDIIMVKAGHAETVSAAGGIDQDVAGVAIVGLGTGADRPTLTFSDTAATMTVAAASSAVKNILIKPSVDSVVSPIVVSAADCDIDVEVQDASDTVECVRAILTTAAADRLNINLKYRGNISGDACVNAIRLVGCDTARINVDFYGVASTSIIEFHTTACHDVVADGKFYNDGTSLTKNVVDTVTGSTWSATGWDGNSNASFSGGDNSALAADDAGAIATAVSTVDGYHDVPTADSTDDAQMRDVIGKKDDAAAAGAVSATESLMAYSKQLVGASFALPQCVAKTDGAVLNGDDELFTIAGGPVRAKIVGVVTTIIGGAANGKLLHTSTTPGGDVDLNAGAVAVDSDAAGTLYYNVGATSIFTPVTSGTILLDPVTVEETEFILPIGTVKFNGSAAQSGVIAWYITFVPLSPLSTVTAAA